MFAYSPPFPALEALQRYTLPRNYAEAHTYLAQIVESMQLLRLYEHYFPDKYVRSQQRSFSNREESFSPMVEEFLLLVDEDLFPINILFLLYGSSPDERDTIIPVRPVGIDWYSTPFEDLPANWQLTLFLLGEMPGEELVRQQPGLQLPEGSELHDTSWGDIHGDRLQKYWKQAAETLHPSVVHLPLIARLAYHSTGNAFLDSTEEMPMEECHWRREDMDFLIEEYRAASAITGQIDELLTWVASDPQHLHGVLSLLRKIQEDDSI